MLEEIKKVFSNKYFYIVFIAGLIIFDYLNGSKIFSVSLIENAWNERQSIAVGQNYIRKSDFDDTAVGSVIANINLGQGQYNDFYFLGASLNTIKTAGDLINTDIVGLLDGATNKPVILETHINLIDQTLEKMSDQSQNLMSMINEKKQETQVCDNAKAQADSNFFQGLQGNENDVLYEGLIDSLSNGPCYIKNRTFTNAYTAIYSKLVYYQNILKSKRDILNNNQDLILQNYSLFRDQYLERLITLRNELGTYQVNVSQ